MITNSVSCVADGGTSFLPQLNPAVTTPLAPKIGLGVGDDPLISNKTLNFDYQATGY